MKFLICKVILNGHIYTIKYINILILSQCTKAEVSHSTVILYCIVHHCSVCCTLVLYSAVQSNSLSPIVSGPAPQQARALLFVGQAEPVARHGRSGSW